MADRIKTRVNKRSGIDSFTYMGIDPISTMSFISKEGSPSKDDYANFNIGALWLDRLTGVYGTLWMLIYKDNNVATWKKIASPNVKVITPDVGIQVVPDGADNINIVGGINVSTVGTANTLTVNVVPDSFADEFVTNVGVAIPINSELRVIGGSNIATIGSGNTVTIALDAETVATSYVTNAGTAIASGGDLNIVGADAISTTGAGNTVTIASSATYPFVTSVVSDAGTANTPVGILNLFGSSGILTSGAGNVVTISNTSVTPTPPERVNFKAYLLADQINVPPTWASNTKVAFDSTLYDIGSGFDVTTGIFVAPIKGIYCFMANVLYKGITGNNSGTWLKVVGTYPETNQTNNINLNAIAYVSGGLRYASCLCTTTTLMDVGDTISFLVGYGTLSTYDIVAGASNDLRTWMSGFLLAEI